jgi:hypothetical protein
MDLSSVWNLPLKVFCVASNVNSPLNSIYFPNNEVVSPEVVISVNNNGFGVTECFVEAESATGKH